MIALKEFIKRSSDGPVMAEREFDIKLSLQLRRLTVDYGIRFKANEVICDDVAADAIFQAAVELLGQVGIYNVATNRAILLRREELKATCRETPGQFVRGSGKDAVTVVARSHNNQRPPYIFRWPLSTQYYQYFKGGKEGLMIETMRTYLSEPTELGELARSLTLWLEGVENKAGTVGETMWAVTVARWSLGVAKAVGQPDMFVGNSLGISVPAILACYAGEGLCRPHHCGISVHIMPELKINWDNLQLAFIARQMGAPRSGGLVSVLGAYARNPEETAIIVTAALLAQLSYAATDWALLTPVDTQGYRASRTILQAHSGACRAAERNIGVATAGMQTTKNGLGSTFNLYERAASTIAQTCSGMAWTWQYPCHPGQDGELKSDLDYELVSKVSRAVSGMDREEANALVNKVLELYEDRWNRPEKGRLYSHYYDLRTLTPSPELVDLYRRVEERLVTLGLRLQ